MASRISRTQLRALINLYRRPCLARGITAFQHLNNNERPLQHLSIDYVWRSQDQYSRKFHTCRPLNGTYQVKMPSLSPTMSEGTIVKWLKKEGDAIAPGDVLCEIQTDKAVMSFEHDEEAILAKILVPENTADVKVGTLIALTVDEGDDWKSVEIPADSSPPPSSSSEAPKPTAPTSAPASAPAVASGGGHGSGRLVGPAVKNYLRKYGLDAGKVPGSGPHGTLTKGDVLKHVLANKLEPVKTDSAPPQTSSPGARSSPVKPTKSKGKTGPATFKDVAISNMRRTIAERLLKSKSTIPHAYGTAQCNMDKLIEFRKSLAAAGIKVSVNDIVIKCVANALSLNPALNCVWEGSTLKRESRIDISVPVATPDGLITPIVSNVIEKDVVAISSLVHTLVAKAKDGKLQPHEIEGGTFSISNIGTFGVLSFSGIIHTPQCAILSVGGISEEIGEDGESISLSKLMLSYDASAIMEDDALKFLAILKNEIENTNEISMGIFDINAKSESLAAAV